MPSPIRRRILATHRASARNLVHYLALRRHDMRVLQERLAALGPGRWLELDKGAELALDAPEIEIMQAREKGDRLRSGRGINMADTELHIPALSDKDLADLDFVARHADLVGLSFTNRPESCSRSRRRAASNASRACSSLRSRAHPSA